MPVAIFVWLIAMVTHSGAAKPAPAWLLAGAGALRRRAATVAPALPGRRVAAAALPPGADFHRVLVPMKLGAVGEEMIATAIALAKERQASVDALYVMKVGLEHSLDAELFELEETAAASLAEAQLLGEENGIHVNPVTVRSRSIGQAIVAGGGLRGADLIVLGSSARWRRQSAFFSPTVDYVLRHAPCEVLVVAFPRGARGLTCAGETRRHRLRARRLAVARDFQDDGWEVTVVDEKEEALTRLGSNWAGGFVVGHGMDSSILRRAGVDEADAVVVATNGDNTNLVIGQVVKKRYGLETVSCASSIRARRVLRRPRDADRLPDPDGDLRARAARPQGRRRGERLMYAIVAGGGKVGANVARSLLRGGHEVTLIEQRTPGSISFRTSSSTRCSTAMRPSSTCSSLRASRVRRSSCSPSPVTTRTT